MFKLRKEKRECGDSIQYRSRSQKARNANSNRSMFGNELILTNDPFFSRDCMRCLGISRKGGGEELGEISRAIVSLN